MISNRPMSPQVVLSPQFISFMMYVFYIMDSISDLDEYFIIAIIYLLYYIKEMTGFGLNFLVE